MDSRVPFDEQSLNDTDVYLQGAYADEDDYLFGSAEDEDLMMQPSRAEKKTTQKPPVDKASKQKKSQNIHRPSSLVIQSEAVENENFHRHYDLTPVGRSKSGKRSKSSKGGMASTPNSHTIDPWEAPPAAPTLEEDESLIAGDENDNQNASNLAKSVFLAPGQIHPNMEHKEDEIAQLRLLAGQISADWRSPDVLPPALARRIRDFQFAQEKRRKKYGDERPWGILGLYDHLSSIRIDVEWANDAALRRENGDPYLSWTEYDESKKRGVNRPYFTYFLLAVCTIVLIVSIALNGWEVEALDVNPMIGPSAQTLIDMGAKETDLIVNHNEGWRLLSSAILHAGLVHYVVNMLALWFVGGAIETSHGWVAAMVIFLISAVGGTIMSSLFLPEYITVGASGGIFGFIGACLADIIMNWKLLFSDFVTENGKKHHHLAIVLVLLFDIALNSVIGLTPYVDNFTHLGGMVYGFLCGLSAIERVSTDFFGEEEGWFTRSKHFFFRFFGIIVSFVAILLTLIFLLQGDGETTPCPSCTWLSCVPFPPWTEDDGKWWYCDDCGRVTANIITRPYLHLEIDCPSGSIAEVNLTSTTLDRAYLERQLPSYCREFCLGAEQ